MSSDNNAIIFRRYQREDRDWVARSNSQHYRLSEGFDDTFDTALADALDWLEARIDNPSSCFLVAERNKIPVGCIFLSADAAEAGRIRLFYLDQSCRGLGHGRRLLRAALEQAGEIGFEAVRVSTFDLHREACALYEAVGFTGNSQPAAFYFGKLMRQVDFERLTTPKAPATKAPPPDKL